MTPKEKAAELFQLYLPFVESGHIEEIKNRCKQCALIAVDEMIIKNGELFLNECDENYYRKKNAFLFEVKQEIKKL
jgi:hypothetical protein